MTERAAITVRRNFPRPDPALVAALKAVPSGYVVDAQGRSGAIDPGIRPMFEAPPFVGPALTVATAPHDNLVPYTALDYAKPGDVLVIVTGGYAGSAVMGDLSMGMAKNCGIVALVTDGLVRDVPGLAEVGLPVFARGRTPNSPNKDGPGSIGLAVTLGGVRVDAGDVIVGDGDGVVVVPQARLAEVVAGLAAVREKERKVEAAIAAGAKRPDWLDAALEAKGLRYVD